MSRLEARYRRLLRLYPAGYRRERADEMVDTYLATVRDDRRWPRVADVADVAAGSVRQRIRAAGPSFAGGRRVAGVLALAAAGGLAAFWLLYVEVGGDRGFGPFRGPGAVVWLAWLAAVVVAVAAPGRAYRWTAAGALAATVAVLPLAPLDRPALMALLPQVAFGLVALALDGRAGRLAASLPLATTAATAAVLLPPGSPYHPLLDYAAGANEYRYLAGAAGPVAGGLVGLAGLLAVVALRARGLWALALLATPVALCFVEPAAREISGKPPWNPADFGHLAVASLGLAVVAAGAAVALGAVARRSGAGQ